MTTWNELLTTLKSDENTSSSLTLNISIYIYSLHIRFQTAAAQLDLPLEIGWRLHKPDTDTGNKVSNQSITDNIYNSKQINCLLTIKTNNI